MISLQAKLKKMDWIRKLSKRLQLCGADKMKVPEDDRIFLPRISFRKRASPAESDGASEQGLTRRETAQDDDNPLLSKRAKV
jgi:hypothetical protein